MFCIHCGAENLDSARFCVACGKNVQSSKPGQIDPAPYAGETEMGLIDGQSLSDRFVVRKLLGVGGMGRVYLAHDRILDRPVAIKVLRDVLSHDTGSVRRLVQEAKAAIRLAHPNIVRIDDYHDAGTVKFLAMEYVEGETLADRLARNTILTEDETRKIAIAVCKGLEHAHQNKVIHRDLKPGNIMLGKDGSVKIADFGIARVARDSVSRLTSQQDSGTLLYMSPEQLLGQGAETGDIYSLGVVLYEMLSGDPPFKSGDIPYQIRVVPPHPLQGISAPLAAIIMKCLQKKAADRFANLTELRESLEKGEVKIQSADAVRWTAAAVKPAPEPRAAVNPDEIPADARILHGFEQQPELKIAGIRGSRAFMLVKHALLGAVAYGGIPLLASPILMEASMNERYLALFVVPPATAFLGSALLHLKRKTIITSGIVCAILGLMLALVAVEKLGPTDIEEATPIVIAFLIGGGAAFGAYLANKRHA
jgi:predicted Ser/Thr protein kinase